MQNMQVFTDELAKSVSVQPKSIRAAIIKSNNSLFRVPGAALESQNPDYCSRLRSNNKHLTPEHIAVVAPDESAQTKTIK